MVTATKTQLEQLKTKLEKLEKANKLSLSGLCYNCRTSLRNLAQKSTEAKSVWTYNKIEQLFQQCFHISICLNQFYIEIIQLPLAVWRHFPAKTVKIVKQKSYDRLELKCLPCCKVWAIERNMQTLHLKCSFRVAPKTEIPTRNYINRDEKIMLMCNTNTEGKFSSGTQKRNTDAKLTKSWRKILIYQTRLARQVEQW